MHICMSALCSAHVKQQMWQKHDMFYLILSLVYGFIKYNIVESYFSALMPPPLLGGGGMLEWINDISMCLSHCWYHLLYTLLLSAAKIIHMFFPPGNLDFLWACSHVHGLPSVLMYCKAIKLQRRHCGRVIALWCALSRWGQRVASILLSLFPFAFLSHMTWLRFYLWVMFLRVLF